MRLWSLMPIRSFEVFREKGVFRTDTKLLLEQERLLAPEIPLEDDQMITAYRWLARKMVERIGKPPPGVEFPVWAWYRWNGKSDPMPDLRWGGHMAKGMEGVRVEMEVPDDSVLRSDFHMWHFPLNFGYLANNNADERQFNRFLRERGINLYKTSHHVLASDPEVMGRLEASWEKILDLKWTRRGYTDPVDKRAVQATMWEFRMEWVMGTKRFRAK